jgi:hypothetical protein
MTAPKRDDDDCGGIDLVGLEKDVCVAGANMEVLLLSSSEKRDRDRDDFDLKPPNRDDRLLLFEGAASEGRARFDPLAAPSSNSSNEEHCEELSRLLELLLSLSLSLSILYLILMSMHPRNRRDFSCAG